MSAEKDSYRRIVTTTSIVGAATLLTIVIGLVRAKAFALAIGPAGIGLMGVFSSIMATAAAVAGMGLGFSGVRLIAAAGDRKALARRALLIATWPLAILGAAAVWFGRDPIARLVTGSDDNGYWIGLSGLGVAFTVLSSSQVAVVQGMQRVGDLARIKIYGALLATLVAVPAVIFGGTLGIVAAVVVVPLANLLLAFSYRPAIPAYAGPAGVAQLREQWPSLFALGTVVMVTGTMSNIALVAIRAIVIDDGGIEAAGLYQAAYAVSAINVGLVLAAMGAHYYPRLTEIAHDPSAANQLVNQQLRAALLIGAPLLVTMGAAAPLILNILYSAEFREAAGLLRWQVVGDLLKLPGWVLGYVLVARRDTRFFLLAEVSFVIVYTIGTYLLQPMVGLSAAGLAYFAAYACYSLLLILFCQKHGVSLSRANLFLVALVLLPLLAIALLAASSPIAAMVVGAVAAAALAAYAFRELSRLTESGSPLEHLQKIRRRIGRK